MCTINLMLISKKMSTYIEIVTWLRSICVILCYIIDDYAVIWINGTKSIMTDNYPMTADTRVKPGSQSETSAGIQERTLIIEQVTRQDSGSYTCRITTTPPIEITHTLHVTRQYLSVYFITLSVLLPSAGLASSAAWIRFLFSFSFRGKWELMCKVCCRLDVA